MSSFADTCVHLSLIYFHLLLRWQFNDIGAHGTKVIVYNLWFSDDGNLELDFDTDPEVDNSFISCAFLVSSEM